MPLIFWDLVIIVPLSLGEIEKKGRGCPGLEISIRGSKVGTAR